MQINNTKINDGLIKLIIFLVGVVFGAGVLFAKIDTFYPKDSAARLEQKVTTLEQQYSTIITKLDKLEELYYQLNTKIESQQNSLKQKQHN